MLSTNDLAVVKNLLAVLRRAKFSMKMLFRIKIRLTFKSLMKFLLPLSQQGWDKRRTGFPKWFAIRPGISTG